MPRVSRRSFPAGATIGQRCRLLGAAQRCPRLACNPCNRAGGGGKRAGGSETGAAACLEMRGSGSEARSGRCTLPTPPLTITRVCMPWPAWRERGIYSRHSVRFPLVNAPPPAVDGCGGVRPPPGDRCGGVPPRAAAPPRPAGGAPSSTPPRAALPACLHGTPHARASAVPSRRTPPASRLPLETAVAARGWGTP